jgi:hypothetical protein
MVGQRKSQYPLFSALTKLTKAPPRFGSLTAKDTSLRSSLTVCQTVSEGAFSEVRPKNSQSRPESRIYVEAAAATRSRKTASWRNSSSTGHKKIRWAPAAW